ncbi:uncharacterized protein LOC133692808 [Populus nigra]|uniref:uncharacterized protein LOC133692808 n=1 Tax=Populus nigra TaxID=3691 RepID=UPI002B26A86C|nr:uncharacterized protein LOC133692808 [Populus nigra]
MATKVDLEKAYDRLYWEFIMETLILTGIPESMIEKCIETASLSVLWNGKISEIFTSTRGIRQGDPLSPYILVLCLERLSQLIQKAVDAGSWRPFGVNREGPNILHLFFADDILLFAEATVGQMDTILECLNYFCAISGQKVSAAKTKLVGTDFESQVCQVTCARSTTALQEYPIWKAICKVLSQVVAGTSWSIGNGKKIRFWKDVWLEGFSQLLQHVAQESSVKESNVLMKDMVKVDNEWRWEEFARRLPMQWRITWMLSNLSSMHVSREDRRWELAFRVTVWHPLKAMNLRIFTDQDLSTYSTVKAIKCMVEEIEKAYIDIMECDRST